MARITELGYMGLGVKSLSRWKEFAAEVCGFEVVDDGEPKRAYLRMDFWHHRYILDEDGSDDITCLGLRVGGHEEFHEMHKQLADAGVKARIGSEEEAEERHVLEIMKLEDPAGNPIEIFHGPHVQYSKPFHAGRGMYGKFVTGDQGMGHCIIRNAGMDVTYKFYTLLGMRGAYEYKVKTPDGNVVKPLFMHCNDRDHTFAFGLGGAKRINHVMIEVDNIDDMAYTYDLVKRMEVPVGITPGKHSNDHQYTFYFMNPSGWLFEYGACGRAATHQSEYYQEDFYGHEPQPDVLAPNWDALEAAE